MVLTVQPEVIRGLMDNPTFRGRELCGRFLFAMCRSKVGRSEVSKRLRHAQVSTTANIYAHVMEEADQRNADILADVFLKKA